MVQILSYTSRPTNKQDYIQKTSRYILYDNRTEVKGASASSRTECVEDISDENKLAGVKLDHWGVRQKLGALKHKSQINTTILKKPN